MGVKWLNDNSVRVTFGFRPADYPSQALKRLEGCKSYGDMAALLLPPLSKQEEADPGIQGELQQLREQNAKILAGMQEALDILRSGHTLKDSQLIEEPLVVDGSRAASFAERFSL